jgi:DhnA family fructose-bisphosphate aldolase class Ia
MNAVANGLPAASRRQRLLGDTDFSIVACADVGLQVGPPGSSTRLDQLRRFAELSVDGVVLTQAAVPTFADILVKRPQLRLIVRLDWSSQWRGAHLSPVANGIGVTVSSPAEAAVSGADGVIHYCLLGHSDPRVEADYIARAAQAVREAHAVGLACILEPLIRGGNAAGNERDAAHMVWGIRTAEELGADAVKVEAPFEADVQEVIGSAAVPVLLASTPPISHDEAVRRASAGAAFGAAGVAYSADFFAAERPDDLVADIRVAASHISRKDTQ